MKKVWILVAVLIILAGAGYVGRHKIKALLGGSSVQPAAPVAKTSTPTAVVTISENIYKTMLDATKGKYMTDFAGRTLYTFDKDTAGVSTCYNACATAWPAYASGAAAQGSLPANVTLVKRTDGTEQFAWKGKPLYYYATDAKSGDITGDGIGGVWHIIKL